MNDATQEIKYLNSDRAVYLPKRNGWFWTVQQGNRTIYIGPYLSRKECIRENQDDPFHGSKIKDWGIG